MDFTEIRNLYHIEGNIGYSSETIEKAVKKFGMLPRVLKEYYQQLGKHSGLNQAHYKLCAPGKMELLIYGDFLCFYKSKNEPLSWYIDLEKPYSDNPSVFRRYLDGSAVRDVLDSETLEGFLYVMAYWQALFSLPYHGVVRYATMKQIDAIRTNFCLKPYDLLKWPQFYGNNSDEVIGVQKENTWAQVYYACNTEKQLTEISAVIRNC